MLYLRTASLWPTNLDDIRLQTHQPCLTDDAHHYAHAHNMDTEEHKNDELFMLGFITGLCKQEPRDHQLLDDMLMFLRAAQEARQQNRAD
jgi:hypothetical protein